MSAPNVRSAYALLVVVVVASALLLVVLLIANPESNTLAFELAKGCIGIFTVALVGFVISNATSKHQQARAHEERDVQRQRDERARKDEFLRSLLDAALQSYHDVKRARREVKAVIWADADGDRVDPAAYDEYLALVDDAQLRFELLKNAAELIDDNRVNAEALAGRFRAIESYLNTLVAEYEKNRRRVAHGDGSVEIAELPELTAFMTSEAFRAGASCNLREAARTLRTALLVPLELRPGAPPRQ